LPGDQFGVEHAVEYVEACLHLSHFPEHPLPEQDMDLYHLVSIIKIPSHYSFSFNGTASGDSTDIVFDQNLTSMNFSEISSGVNFCRIKADSGAFLEAWDEHGKNRSTEFFTLDGDEYKLTVSVMPAMLTDDIDIIRMDCLCYLMERIDWKSIQEAPEIEKTQEHIS